MMTNHALVRKSKELYYCENGTRKYGLHAELICTTYPVTITGNCTLIRGNCAYLEGDITSLRGNVSEITGIINGLWGDVTLLTGDITNVSGCADKIAGDCSDFMGDLSYCIPPALRDEMDIINIETLENSDRPQPL
jgi:hypothetical protein